MSEPVNTSGAYIIVTGNEKGGCGKTTITMHLAVSMLYDGMKVATIDLDARQRSLSRYVENRLKHAESLQKDLPQLSHYIVNKCDLPNRDEAEADERSRFEKCLAKAAEENDVVIVDAPGNDTFLSRLAHSYADTIVTPINDSFIDLDVLAHIKEETLDMSRPGVYSEIVWQAKMQRAKRDRGEIDWVVLRNRLSNLDAHNKRQMADALDKLSRKTGCRIAQGLSERVIYRELFLKGLTLLDIMDEKAQVKVRMTHIAARQELRELAHFLDLNYRIQQKTGASPIAPQTTGDADEGAPKAQDEALSSQETGVAAQTEVQKVQEETEAPVLPKKPELQEAEKADVMVETSQVTGVVTQENVTTEQESETPAHEEQRHHYSLDELSQIEAEMEAREGVVDSLDDLQGSDDPFAEFSDANDDADAASFDDESIEDIAATDSVMSSDDVVLEEQPVEQQADRSAVQGEEGSVGDEGGLSDDTKAKLNAMLAKSKQMMGEIEADSGAENVEQHESVSPDTSMHDNAVEDAQQQSSGS